MSSGDESVEEIVRIPDIDEETSDQPIETIEEQEGTTEAIDPNTVETNNSDDENQAERKVVKPKRVIKNPQPKFNEQTLKTPKGLPAIAGHFKRVKFKGKGHEEKDLNVLMKTYEYWCHRLFPKYPFDASIARLETLGTKKATQTQLKILRAGLELEDDQKLMSDEEEIPAVDGFVDNIEDPFDQLLPRTQVEKQPEISEEQLERMKLNRIRAENLKKQKLARANKDTSQSISQISNENITRGQIDQMDVQDSEEVDFDGILDIINEGESPSTNPDNSMKTQRSVNPSPRFLEINENNRKTTKQRRRIDSDSEDDISNSQHIVSEKQDGEESEICSTPASVQENTMQSMDSDEESTNGKQIRNSKKINMIHSDEEISRDGSPLLGSKNTRKTSIDSDHVSSSENGKTNTNSAVLSETDEQ